MDQYKIECEECETESHVFSYDQPQFCPACGRRVEAEKFDEFEIEATLDY